VSSVFWEPNRLGNRLEYAEDLRMVKRAAFLDHGQEI
jgi:hypothetical protein